MLNLSLAVYEAITPRKNSQNLMTLLCVIGRTFVDV